MTTEISTERRARLPRQVLDHFPNATTDERKMLASVYSGNKEEPNFTEWLESYQQSELFKIISQGGGWMGRLLRQRETIQKEYDEKVAEHKLSEEDEKYYQKELKRITKLSNSVSDQYLAFSKELTKLVQNNLIREAPRKIEMTTYKVTPGDVANLLNEAKNTINIKGKKV